MSRDLRLYLTNIQSSITKINTYIEGIDSIEDFLQDGKTFDAVVMNLQIIGESVKYIPPDMCSEHPQIPWKSVVGLRDIISHTYDLLEEEIIWDVVRNELSLLHDATNSILKKLLES